MPVPTEPIGTFGNWITERLATGGALGSGDQGQQNVAALVLAGINCIIDCQGELDDSPILAKIGHYVWCPTADDGQTKPPAYFAPGFQLALSVLALPGGRCYTHCAAGVNRGPSMAFGILRALGLTMGEAMLLVTTGRPQAQVRYAGDADHAVQALGYTVGTP
jgi:hypothetical protein